MADTAQQNENQETVEEEENQEVEAGEEAPEGEEGGEEEPQDEVASLKEQLLRAMAEVENTRRRARLDVEEAGKYAVTGFAREIVGVVDNLQRATASIPPEAREADPNVKNLAEGVDMTLRELLSALEKHGIQPIDPMGEKFDPNRHQAVVQIETDEQAPGTVVQVMQTGYILKDRLLRPAMVGVAKAPAESTS